MIPRVDRRLSSEHGRDFDHRLVDEDGDRVQVAGVGGQAEPLGLERDRPATGEWIQHGRRLALTAEADEFARLADDLLVSGRFPGDEGGDEIEEAVARRVLHLAVVAQRQAEAGLQKWTRHSGIVRVRIGDERGEEHGAGGSQRAARPPEVERGGVTVTDGLFACGSLVDGVEGQCDLNEAGCRRHELASGAQRGPV